MSANGTTMTDNDGSNTSEPALTETEQEAQETQQPVTAADPMTVMQSALASFDGLRVDAAIQVQVLRTIQVIIQVRVKTWSQYMLSTKR